MIDGLYPNLEEVQGLRSKAIAQRLSTFGAIVSYWDRQSLDKADEIRLNVKPLEFDQLISSSTFLVCALPLSAETKHLLGAEQLAKMPKGALLINPALVIGASFADLFSIVVSPSGYDNTLRYSLRHAASSDL